METGTEWRQEARKRTQQSSRRETGVVWTKLVEEEEARAVTFGVDLEGRNDLSLD